MKRMSISSWGLENAWQMRSRMALLQVAEDYRIGQSWAVVRCTSG
jgi:hypothetical protein